MVVLSKRLQGSLITTTTCTINDVVASLSWRIVVSFAFCFMAGWLLCLQQQNVKTTTTARRLRETDQTVVTTTRTRTTEPISIPCNKPILSVDNIKGNFTSFIDAVFDGLNEVVVNDRPIIWLANNYDTIPNTHKGGNWLEFGVWEGDSIIGCYNRTKKSANFRGGKFFGFDSFQGLPSEWRKRFKAGRFATSFDMVREKVPAEITLLKGWFQESIPKYIEEYHPNQEPLALVHHDGDLFVSTAITFQLLGKLIRPGTLMCFDELVGYPGYQQHEILSLFLWMHQYHAKLCPLSFFVPFITPEQRLAEQEQDHFHQSACYQVVAMD